mmetsp:Transcript_4845/g.11650  ORF Transcript_4845/g.11650 Transcript_4845/m.11650 type:complete len:216 (-) Transcript_4845:46-693(-)
MLLDLGSHRSQVHIRANSEAHGAAHVGRFDCHRVRIWIGARVHIRDVGFRGVARWVWGGGGRMRLHHGRRHARIAENRCLEGRRRNIVDAVARTHVMQCRRGLVWPGLRVVGLLVPRLVVHASPVAHWNRNPCRRRRSRLAVGHARHVLLLLSWLAAQARDGVVGVSPTHGREMLQRLVVLHGQRLRLVQLHLQARWAKSPSHNGRRLLLVLAGR